MGIHELDPLLTSSSRSFVSASGNTTHKVPLHETFFEPSILLSGITPGTSGGSGASNVTPGGSGGIRTTTGGRGGIPRLARGITKQSPRVQDRHFSGQVRGQLFATECVSGSRDTGGVEFCSWV